MASAGFAPAGVPRGTRRTAMLRPKPKAQRGFIPPLPDHELAFLAGKLGPDERKALRQIVATADLIEAGDGGPWLLVPTTPTLIGALAAFEADAEDRENDLEDEPQDVDDDTNNDLEAVNDWG